MTNAERLTHWVKLEIKACREAGIYRIDSWQEEIMLEDIPNHTHMNATEYVDMHMTKFNAFAEKHWSL